MLDYVVFQVKLSESGVVQAVVLDLGALAVIGSISNGGFLLFLLSQYEGTLKNLNEVFVHTLH